MDMTAIRRRVLTASEPKKKRLPSEYQEVEYIESTGTQWIDTGILGNSGIKIVCEMGWAAADANNHQLFGSRYGGTRFYITSYRGIDFAHGSDFSKSASIEARRIYNFVYDTSRFIDGDFDFYFGYDDNMWNEKVSPVNTDLSMYIFGTNRTSSTTQKFLYPVIFVSMIITDANEKVLFNGIPCYRKSDREIGIYDTVTKTFLTNQGTGTLLKGADV